MKYGIGLAGLLLLSIMGLSMAETAAQYLSPDGMISSSAWSNYGCSSNWECVDDEPLRRPYTGDYIYTTTNTTFMSLENFDETDCESVNFVRLVYFAIRYDSTHFLVVPWLNSQTSNVSGPTQVLSANWTSYTLTAYYRPGTENAWECEDIDGAVIGFTMPWINSSYGGARIAQAYVYVDYNTD